MWLQVQRSQDWKQHQCHPRKWGCDGHRRLSPWWSSLSHADCPSCRQASAWALLPTFLPPQERVSVFVQHGSWEERLWFLPSRYSVFLSSLSVVLRITPLLLYALRLGFLSLISSITINNQIIPFFFLQGGWPVNCRMFNSLPGPYAAL